MVERHRGGMATTFAHNLTESSTRHRAGEESSAARRSVEARAGLTSHGDFCMESPAFPSLQTGAALYDARQSGTENLTKENRDHRHRDSLQ